MNSKTFPRSMQMTDAKLIELIKELESPFWAYDGDIIKMKINQLRDFDVIRYAQKALSNVNILKLVRQHGAKVDSVSLGEIERAIIAGFKPGTDDSEIIFTADVLNDKTCERVVELKIPVNAGSIDMLEKLGNSGAEAHPVWLRVNPGFGHGHSQKVNTGGENSKHGIWHEDLPLAFSLIKKHKLKLIGLHMHIGSGLFSKNFERVCEAMADLVIKSDQDVKAISAGGGVPIPYRENEEGVDVENYYQLWDKARKKIENHLGHKVELEIEPGRFLVAESGILVTQVLCVKNMGSKRYVLVNSGFNDLVRPAMYGCYHHITVLGDTSDRPMEEVVVAGHLCESGDVFTQADGGHVLLRLLPKIYVGDYLVFNNTGAYGSSMSSNYNSHLLLPEVLFEGGNSRMIKRKQTIEELIALEQ
jgi:diaminopimelate decarboxylase